MVDRFQTIPLGPQLCVSLLKARWGGPINPGPEPATSSHS